MSMTRDEAIARLLELAKDHIAIVDGEWGCRHTYQEALTNRREGLEDENDPAFAILDCDMHKTALEISALEAILTVVVTR